MLATIEDLLKAGKEREKKKKFKVLVKELDREIECETISRKDYLDIILENKQDSDVEVIYNSCSIFRDDKLIDELKCNTYLTEMAKSIDTTGHDSYLTFDNCQVLFHPSKEG